LKFIIIFPFILFENKTKRLQVNTVSPTAFNPISAPKIIQKYFYS